MAFKIINKTPDFEQRKAQEALPWFTGAVTVEYASPGQNLVNGFQIFQMYTFAGESAYLRQFRIWTTVENTMELQLRSVENGLTTNGGYIGQDSGDLYSIDERIQLSASKSPVIVDLNGIWIPENTQIKLSSIGSYNNVIGKFAMSSNSLRFTNDFNWTADKTILVIGDSIVKGSLGPINTYNSSDVYPWKVRDWFINKGQNTRLVNKGAGGRTSRDGRDWMIKQRFYDIADAALIIYAFGMNNVTGGFNETKQSAFLEDIEAAIQWKKGKYPRAKMVLCGPSPAQNTSREESLGIARSIIKEAVEKAEDARVFYLNLGDAFPATDSSFYSSTDGSGDRLHPNIIGHQAIYDNCWYPFLNETIKRI